MPDAVTAAIGGGASILGSIITGKGQEAAAEAQIQAADAASQAQLQMYYQNRADLAPWREAGESALGTIQNVLADPSQITTMPGYQFGMQQGTQALERGAAARGKQLSGAQLNALQTYGQNYAGTQLQNYLSPYFNLAGYGQTATAQTAQSGTQAAQGQANALVSAMPAYAQQAYSPYGTTGSILDWAGSNYLNYALLKQMGAFGSGSNALAYPSGYSSWGYGTSF
jgi:hypothetical protein